MKNPRPWLRIVLVPGCCALLLASCSSEAGDRRADPVTGSTGQAGTGTGWTPLPGESGPPDGGSSGSETSGGPAGPSACGDDACGSGEDCGSCPDDCGACPDQDAAIVTGPWLQAATEGSIVIMWETDREVPGVVEYGASEALGTTVVSAPTTLLAAHCDPPCPDYGDGEDPIDSAAVLHEVELTGLEAGQTYHYRVRMGSVQSDPLTFHTNAQSGPYRFVHITDLHFFAIQAQRDRFNVALSLDPEFVLMTGDLVQTSINDEFRLFMQRAQESTGVTNWYMERGNHENRPWSTFTDWYDNTFPGNLEENYYAFTVGDILFVGINEVPVESQFPKDWLMSALETSAAWKVVFAKKPPWQQGREYLYPLFEDGGVDLVLTSYCTDTGAPDQIGGVWYLTQCEGGPNLIETGADEWTLTQHQTDGTVVRTTEIQN